MRTSLQARPCREGGRTNPSIALIDGDEPARNEEKHPAGDHAVAIRSDQSRVETTLLPEKVNPPSTGIVEP